jgi:hypothetical protein
MWEQGLFGDFVAPSLAYAPAGGRFALSRVLLRISAVPDQPISADEVSTQSVVVYQTNTGKQLLRADCSPVERAGQNFTLSPNGLALAVVHADAIEIYNLPPLSTKDEAELKLAQSSAPEESNLPVRFSAQAAPSSAEADSANPSPPSPAPAAAPSAPSDDANLPVLFSPPAAQPAQQPPPTTQTPATQSSGDAPPEQHRAPPTLYNLPNDKVPASDKPKETPQ